MKYDLAPYDRNRYDADNTQYGATLDVPYNILIASTIKSVHTVQIISELSSNYDVSTSTIMIAKYDIQIAISLVGAYKHLPASITAVYSIIRELPAPDIIWEYNTLSYELQCEAFQAPHLTITLPQIYPEPLPASMSWVYMYFRGAASPDSKKTSSWYVKYAGRLQHNDTERQDSKQRQIIEGYSPTINLMRQHPTGGKTGFPTSETVNEFLASINYAEDYSSYGYDGHIIYWTVYNILRFVIWGIVELTNPDTGAKLYTAANYYDTQIYPYRIVNPATGNDEWVEKPEGWIFEATDSRWDVAQKLADYAKFVFHVKLQTAPSGTVAYPYMANSAYFVDQNNIDLTYDGLDLPAAIIFAGQANYKLAGAIKVAKDNLESPNRVIVSVTDTYGTTYRAVAESDDVVAHNTEPIEYLDSPSWNDLALEEISAADTLVLIDYMQRLKAAKTDNPSLVPIISAALEDFQRSLTEHQAKTRASRLLANYQADNHRYTVIFENGADLELYQKIAFTDLDDIPFLDPVDQTLVYWMRIIQIKYVHENDVTKVTCSLIKDRPMAMIKGIESVKVDTWKSIMRSEAISAIRSGVGTNQIATIVSIDDDGKYATCLTEANQTVRVRLV
jgi:hypothetical protein